MTTTLLSQPLRGTHYGRLRLPQGNRDIRERLFDRTLQRVRWASGTQLSHPIVPTRLFELAAWLRETDGFDESFRSYTFKEMASHPVTDLKSYGVGQLVRLLHERLAHFTVFQLKVSDEVIGRVDIEFYRHLADKAYLASTLREIFMSRVQSWAEERLNVHRLCLP